MKHAISFSSWTFYLYPCLYSYLLKNGLRAAQNVRFLSISWQWCYRIRPLINVAGRIFSPFKLRPGWMSVLLKLAEAQVQGGQDG